MSTSTARQPASLNGEIRPNVLRFDRVAFVGLIVALTWPGREHPGPDGPATVLFVGGPAGFPWIYWILAGLLLIITPAALRRQPISMPAVLKRTRLWVPAVAGLLAVAIALALALLTGATILFADWRNLAVMAVGATLLTRWLAGRAWTREILVDLAIGYGFAALFPLTAWLLGSGSEVQGQVVPAYSYAHNSMAVFAATISSASLLQGQGRLSGLRTAALLLAFGSSSGIALLSFRRGVWVMWLLAIAGVAWTHRRKLLRSGNYRGLTVVGVLILVAAGAVAAFGVDTLSEKLESFDPSVSQSDNQFSSTTEGHIGEVMDALDVILEEPILGLGIGKWFETSRVFAWKSESFVVHSAPVHVWLKFGLLGLFAYLAFHFRWVQGLLTVRMKDPIKSASFVALGVFLVAEFVASLAATWPYGRLSLAVHHAVVLSVFFAEFPTESIRRHGNRVRVKRDNASKLHDG